MHGRLLRRSALLPLIFLAGAGSIPAPPPSAPPKRPGFTGVYGEFLSARFALAESDLDRAADQFLRALASEPDNPELLHQTFLACALAGRPEAPALAERLPNDPTAQMLLANEDARAERWDAATGRLMSLPHDNAAGGSDPDRGNASPSSGRGGGHADLSQFLQPLLLAWAQQGAGHTNAALATLRPEESGPRRGIFTLHAALIADQAGRGVEAGHLYRAARDGFGALNLRLAQILASWQARRGQLADAQSTLRALLDSSPDLAIAQSALEADVATRAVPRPADGMAEAYLAVAASLRQQENTDAALLMLRFALSLRPDLTAGRLVLADLQQQQKHPGLALATLAAVPANDPLLPVALLRKAAIVAAGGDSAAALRQLEQLAREYPDSPEPLIQQADLLRETNHYGDAVQAYSRALAKIPHPDASDWVVFYARAIAYDHTHDWPQAQADLQHALHLSPDQPAVLNYLGYSWAEQGRNLDEARGMIEKALDQRPEEASIIDSLGWVMLRQGQVEDAVQTLQRAAELDPEDSDINGHLGDADQAAGHWLDARYQWQLALTFHPSPEQAAKLNAKLQKAAAEEAAHPSGQSPPIQGAQNGKAQNGSAQNGNAQNGGAQNGDAHEGQAGPAAAPR